MSPPPANRRLSEEDILRAAIALIDVDGLASLTMRRLGASLDVEAMALYRYFPSRHDLLDRLVDHVVGEVATDPASQWNDEDDWRDYLDRLAHGVRRMALTHPRVFPLVASHPTTAPWIRPPIRSLSWVEAFLRGLQDHHFPPPAAVTVYKRFSTFLLGHLLLEVAALGLEFPPEASAPAPPPDPDRRAADRLRRERATAAADTMADGPSAEEILAADPSPTRAAEEPAVQAGDDAVATAVAGADTEVDAVRAEVDVPVVAAVVSTSSVDLEGFPIVTANAGLLALDTGAADFARALDLLLDDVAGLRRP